MNLYSRVRQSVLERYKMRRKKSRKLRHKSTDRQSLRRYDMQDAVLVGVKVDRRG